jgi:alanyl-tRNA synthetase
LLLASVTKDLVERHQLKAGDLMKELAPLIGGKGGGPPTMASGSGKEPSQLPAALDRARTLLASKLAK